MSQRRYRKEGGCNCPFCGSSEISGGSVEIGNGTASQEVDCNVCHKVWSDTYVLQGYEEVE